MRRNIISTIFLALALQATWIGCAVAETFGPYFYRAGDEQSYGRFETTVQLNGNKLVVNNCAEQMHFLVSQGPRQCWSESYGETEFSADKESIRYVSGDVEKVDRQSRRFTVEDRLDRSVIVRDVSEHFGGWENTPASWQTR